MDDAGKRTTVHFADDVVIVGEKYYYRGTPVGEKKRIEISLDVPKGAPQKDVLKARKEKLDNRTSRGVRVTSAVKTSFSNLLPKYIQSREVEAKDPKVLSQSSLTECKILGEKHFLPFLGSKRVEDIDQPLFDDYCHLKAKDDYALPNHRKFINHFLKWCVSKGYLRMRPELWIPKGTQKEKRQRVVLTEAQAKALVEACAKSESGNVLLYVMMYLFMGMRNKEILRLRWDEVDLKARALKVNGQNNRRRKNRVIPINPFVVNLMKHRERNEKNEWVFPTKKKDGRFPHISPDGGIRTPWKTALKRAGIDDLGLTPHDLRATFETFMHTNVEFTDTQREKMAGAAIDVQKNIYVTMDASHLRGLENSVQIKGVSRILGGSRWGKKAKAKPSKRLSSRKKNGKRK